MFGSCVRLYDMHCDELLVLEKIRERVLSRISESILICVYAGMQSKMSPTVS